MTPLATQPAAPVWRRSDGVVLILILLLAAALRLPGLDHDGYTIDEYWKAELAYGYGSPHLRLPVDVVGRPADLFDLSRAAPWWHVWTHLEGTHPPLYYVALRLWIACLGPGDATERALSAVESVVAVAVLFDVVRLLNGRAAAGWAALLMAVAAPQVEHARLTSNYAQELATVLLAADAVVRIERLGPTGRRWAGLTLAVLASLLTHYFCVGLIAGLGGYAVVRLRGRSRVAVVTAMAAAGAAFLLCWGPFMWRQRALFATDDPFTRFVRDDGPGHVGRVLWVAANVPATMLAPLPPSWAAAGSVLAVAYVLPFALARRRPDLLLWGWCLAGSVGLILALDLSRRTQQVAFVRYVIPAGPSVFAIVAAGVAAIRPRRLGLAIGVATVAVVGAFVGRTYASGVPSPRPLIADLARSVGPDDVVVLAATAPDQWFTAVADQMVVRYLRPFPCPLVIEHGPPGPATAAALRRRRRVYVLTLGPVPPPVAAGLTLVGRRAYAGDLWVWVLTPAGVSDSVPRPFPGDGSMPTLALIGCAHIHTPGFVRAINERPGVTVKHVWDPNPARAAKRAAELKAAVIADPAAAYADPAVDGVVVCSETDRHEAVVMPAVAAKKRFLFVEKPLGYAAADAAKMADAITAAGVTFQTGYFRRGDAKHIFLKEQIDAGAFGKITRVRGSNCHSGALGGWFDAKPSDPADDWRWMADPKVAGCGAFGDLGTHMIDVMIWLCGEVTAATAQLDVGTNRYDGCDETGEGLLRFKSGAIGTIAASWDDLADPVSLVVTGTEGYAYVHGDHLHFQSKHVAGSDLKTPWTALPPKKAAGFEAFLDAVEGKPATLVTPAEAAYRSRVVEALYAGAKGNTWATV